MAAGLGALRHDDIRAERGRRARVGERLHLQDQPRSGGANRRHERRRIAEREHDRDRLARQRRAQPIGMAGEMPGDETDADRRAVRGCELPLDPGRVVIARADQAETAGPAHGRSERPARHRAHRRQKDRVADAEKVS